MLAALRTRRGTGPDMAAESISFDALYRGHARRVFRWAQRLGGPAVEPDEVLQEVFITVNRRLARFSGHENLITWLFRITAHVVANQRRSWRRRRFRSMFLSRSIAETAASHAPGPSEVLEGREAGARFYRVLDRLTDRHRNVLVLFELEELSTDEIAVLIGRPPATVRVWLHRARAAFDKHWRAENGHETAAATNSGVGHERART